MMLRIALLCWVLTVSEGCVCTPKPKPKPRPPTTTPPPQNLPPLPTRSGCKCGKANRGTRIVNGVTTAKNEFPWQVALTRTKGYNRPFCGGSIISTKSILTAAHCILNVRPGQFYVVVGEHDLLKRDGEKYMSVCRTARFSYNPKTFDYDFAVLELCEELKWAKDVQPVCLPTTLSASRYENKACITTGWGRLRYQGSQPNKLQKLAVRSISNKICCEEKKPSCSEITPRMICAEVKSETDTCNGDSGGPLVTLEGSSYIQIGITSWGYSCKAKPYYPAVFARVTNQLNFIRKHFRGTTCSR